MTRELLWWRSFEALLVIWAACLELAAFVGWDIAPMAVLAIGLLLAFSYLVEPARPWWGPDIAAVMKDREWMRRRLPELVVVMIGATFGLPLLIYLVRSALIR
jgi:hypothetical protein